MLTAQIALPEAVCADVYDADATIDDGSCIYYPESFQFNQSTLQAFYFIENAFIDREDLEEFVDWIAIFKDSVCVGAYPWVGGNMNTTLPAMGQDANDNTWK